MWALALQRNIKAAAAGATAAAAIAPSQAQPKLKPARRAHQQRTENNSVFVQRTPVLLLRWWWSEDVHLREKLESFGAMVDDVRAQGGGIHNNTRYKLCIYVCKSVRLFGMRTRSCTDNNQLKT